MQGIALRQNHPGTEIKGREVEKHRPVKVDA
jgi:hypothetical protein